MGMSQGQQDLPKNPTRNNARKEKERKTEEMGAQHHRMDRKGVERQIEEGRRQR